MWEKEKLLVQAISPFPHNVFKRLPSQTCQKVLLSGNGLNPRHHLLHCLSWLTLNPLPDNIFLDCSKFKSQANVKMIVTQNLNFILGRVENILGKGENAGVRCFFLKGAPPGWLSGERVGVMVVSSIPGWGDFSFRRIFAFHLCRSMWEK